MAPNRALYLLDRIGSLLRSEIRKSAAEDGLEPVHLQALLYVTQANALSNNPLAVGEYLGLTKGNMSQRLIVLESKGFIRKTPDVVDKRRVHLEVTEEGKAVLAKSYPPRIWPPSGGDLELETLLDGLLRQVVAETGGRMFGQCRTCRFHEVRGANDRHCGLLQLPLTEDQAGKLCREHELRRSREMTHPC